MKIGVSSYSFAKYIKSTGASYFEICDLAKSMGFEAIDFINLDSFGISGDPIEIAKEIGPYCEKIGLPVAAYTVSANLLSDDIRAQIDYLKKCVDVTELLGAKILRHDVCGSLRKLPNYTYRDAIKEMVPAIREVTEYARSKGIRTCTENHGQIFQAAERVEELILAVDNDNYGWLCDIGNFLCADRDPVASVSVAAPYAFHVHAKDFLFKSGEFDAPDGYFKTAGMNALRGTVLGHGIVPVKTCMKILQKHGYDGCVCIEFEGLEDNIKALEYGISYLRKCI